MTYHLAMKGDNRLLLLYVMAKRIDMHFIRDHAALGRSVLISRESNFNFTGVKRAEESSEDDQPRSIKPRNGISRSPAVIYSLILHAAALYMYLPGEMRRLHLYAWVLEVPTHKA